MRGCRRGYWRRRRMNGRMNTPKPLRPNLWTRLPSALIDDIIHKVLIDLPFSKLYSFCSFCKRWRDFLLSKTHYLLYLHIGKLKAFNSRRGMWEEISLKFCERRVPGLKRQNLLLVSSAGGLLCLSNTANGEYILCNPLTRRCKRLGKCRWGPSNRLEPQLPQTRKLGTRVVAYKTWPAADAPYICQEVLTIYQRNITGDVQLMLSTSFLEGRRQTIVHDYRRTSGPAWEIVTQVQDDFRFYVDGPVMVSREQLALGFHRATHSVGFNVLVYDLNMRQYEWLTAPQIPQRGRKQLVGTISGSNEFRFEEIRDTGHTELAFPPPLTTAFEDLLARISEGLRGVVIAGKAFEMVYIEQDDVVYLVATVAHEPNGLYNVIAVWRRCRVDSSDLISEWKAEWSNNLGRPIFQSRFHVFKPSFSF